MNQAAATRRTGEGRLLSISSNFPNKLPPKLSQSLLPSLNDHCFETYWYSKFIQVIQEILHRLTLKTRRKQSYKGLDATQFMLYCGAVHLVQTHSP